MIVEFLNEHDHTLLTVSLDANGGARWTGALTLDGTKIADPSTGDEIPPSDGENFMRALPSNYRSAYLRAVLVWS